MHEICLEFSEAFGLKLLFKAFKCWLHCLKLFTVNLGSLMSMIFILYFIGGHLAVGLAGEFFSGFRRAS